MEWIFVALVVALSLLPPLAFAFWVRNREKYDREPARAILGAFAFGSTIGIVVAFILNTLFDTAASRFAADAGISSIALTAVFAAPFIEEATKGLGMTRQIRFIQEPEDGLVYGAALGLGFAATENLLYAGTSLIEDGAPAAIATVSLRIVSSMILHAGASAIVGYGFALVALRLKPVPVVFMAYLVAAFLHGAYNFLALMQSLIALAASLALAWFVFGLVRRRIETLDAESG